MNRLLKIKWPAQSSWIIFNLNVFSFLFFFPVWILNRNIRWMHTNSLLFMRFHSIFMWLLLWTGTLCKKHTSHIAHTDSKIIPIFFLAHIFAFFHLRYLRFMLYKWVTFALLKEVYIETHIFFRDSESVLCILFYLMVYHLKIHVVPIRLWKR